MYKNIEEDVQFDRCKVKADFLHFSGCEKLGLKGRIQVVLEEDGTEVDSDEVLHACVGKVFILKEVGTSWRNSRLVTTMDTLPPDSTRF